MNLILLIIFVITRTDGSSYRVIDSSNIQEFFHLSQNFYHALKKNITEKRKKNNEYKYYT